MFNLDIIYINYKLAVKCYNVKKGFKLLFIVYTTF